MTHEDENSLFAPAGQMTRTDYSELIAEIEKTDLPLKDRYIVPTTARDEDYIPQIAEYDGLNTCLPTSVLNGFVHQGYLNREQAQAAQDYMEKQDGMFMRGLVAGRMIRTFAVPTIRLVDLVRDVNGVETDLQIVEVRGFNQEITEKLLKVKLQQGMVMVGGNNDHGVLIIGYDNKGDRLLYRDPMQPNEIRSTNASSFTRDFRLSSEPYLHIVPKPPTPNT